jgi:hypothetical protein
MAIDTIISNDELVVVGPPASVSVSVDIGPQGERGSQFFSGVGPPLPDNASILTNAKINDLYINNRIGSKYGVVYKLDATPGGSIWTEILRFQPTSYAARKNVDFVSGSGSISIPLADFYNNAPESLNPETILVQATPEIDDPAFISISNKDIQDVSGSRTFIVELKGAKFVSGSASLISSSATPISFFISVGGVE